MQRRRISADIVTNPSASERKHYTSSHDSAFASHGQVHATLPSQRSQHRQTTLPRRVEIDSIALPSFSSSTSSSLSFNSLSHGYSTASNLQEVNAQPPVEMNDSCVPLGSSLPVNYSSTLSHGICSTTATDAARLAFRYPSPAYSGSTTGSASSVCSNISVSLPGNMITPPDDSVACSPPRLAKETAKQYSYVDSLVDVATMITNSLWPCPDALTSRKSEHSVRMLSYFITETSRKSKTSLSTMQLALLYCIRFKRDQLVLKKLMDEHNSVEGNLIDDSTASVGSTCARRNFLSALILASKYLQDRNFSNKAWSKISSVTVAEINLREREFLEITKWNLDVKHDVFKDWSSAMEIFTHDVRYSTMFGDVDICQRRWKSTVEGLVSSNDLAIRDMIARIAKQKPTYHETAIITPAATPSEELAQFCVPQKSPEIPATPPASQVVLDVSAQTQVPGTLSCPFFEEFIVQSTPLDSFLTIQNDAVQGPEAHYLTPESMRTLSPSISGGESECHSPSSSDMHHDDTVQPVPFRGHNLEEFLSEFLHVPSTPSIRPLGSFSLLSQSETADSPVQRPVCEKRKREEEVEGRHHCRGVDSALGKRVKKAF